MSYKLNKHVKIEGYFRLGYKRKLDNSYNERYRYFFDFTYKTKSNPFVFSFRTRFQDEYRKIYNSSDDAGPFFYLREKANIKLNLNKKYIPYFSTEAFFNMNSIKIQNMNNLRASLGLEYEINKKSSFELFYLIQQEYLVANPTREFILGIGYHLLIYE